MPSKATGRGGSSSDGVDDTAGSDDSNPPEGTGTVTTDQVMSSSGNDQTDGTGDPAMDDDSSGCSCRSERPSPSFAALWLLLGAGLRRRRSGK